MMSRKRDPSRKSAIKYSVNEQERTGTLLYEYEMKGKKNVLLSFLRTPGTSQGEAGAEIRRRNKHRSPASLGRG